MTRASTRANVKSQLMNEHNYCIQLVDSHKQIQACKNTHNSPELEIIQEISDDVRILKCRLYPKDLQFFKSHPNFATF